jgi:hypothetical protein
MRVKHALACRRPVEYSPQIQPMIPTPGHGSFPSGHATEAFVTAFVFEALLAHAHAHGTAGGHGSPIFVQLMRIAERIAINRTVAGVHFPVDSVAGMVLGRTLAEFFLARFGTHCHPRTRQFDGRGFARDFCYEEVLAMDPVGAEASADTFHVATSSHLAHLWTQALAEVKLVVGPPSTVSPSPAPNPVPPNPVPPKSVEYA